MDGSRFDDLAKSLGAQRTRRGVLGALAGAALASLGVRSTEAHVCRSLGNSCKVGGDCCSGNCVAESRTRKICHCGSAGDCPPTVAACQKAVCAGGACSSAVDLGARCDDSDACTTNDVCQSDGSCAGTPVVCTASNECFTIGACQAGACPDPVYLGDGAACTGGVCFSNACCVPESAGTTCAGGKCGAQTNNCGQSVQCLTAAGGSCASDSACCSGVCVNSVCQAGTVATGGTCDSNSDCASGHCCSSTCRDLSTDPDNCGSCATVCSDTNMATRTCSGGVCNGTCQTGYADCDGNKLFNGCETNLSDDVSHCGGCGVVCSSNHVATRTCSGGVCNGACSPGFADCNGNKQSDGCETDVAGNQDNCGACGHECATGETCSGGVCMCGSSAACDATHYCSGGTCAPLCPAGTCASTCPYCLGGPDGSFCANAYGLGCAGCDRDSDCPSGQHCLSEFTFTASGKFGLLESRCHGGRRGYCSATFAAC